MNCKSRWMAGAVLGAALWGAPAMAQWKVTALGVGEVDTKSTLLILGGLSATTGAKGIAPIIGAQAYYLTFNPNSSRTNVTEFKPYVGLAENYNGGSVSGTIGYAWTNSDNNSVPLVGASTDVGEGTVLSGGWDHWGTGGPWGHQLLASYNFGSESFWGRGRVTKQISSNGPAQHRAGVEVAALHGNGYSIIQPGVLMEFHNGKGSILGLGVGGKFPKSGDAAAYFKVEGLLPVGR